jgi:hypothetical protein
MIVTVRGGAATSPPPMDSQVLPGPYATLKSAVLDRAGERVRLVTDYDRLPLMLVEVHGQESLDSLAADPNVASVQREKQRTVS